MSTQLDGYDSPRPVLIADRCMKARTESHCALGSCWITPGTRIARLPDGRWATVACIVRATHPDTASPQ